MIEPGWKRIAAVECQADGKIGVVWLALDKESDCLHLYDAHIFEREVLAVVAEGINRRGKWIPLAWNAAHKDMITELLDRGANTLTEGVKDTDMLAEVSSRELWERMRMGSFKVNKALSGWLDEYRGFARRDGKIPREGYPLMTATRYAVAMVDWSLARPKSAKTFPEAAIV